MINLGAQHENLDQKAYSILKDLIMERRLLPGQKIPQEKLARDLGISRTPLISALKSRDADMIERPGVCSRRGDAGCEVLPGRHLARAPRHLAILDQIKNSNHPLVIQWNIYDSCSFRDLLNLHFSREESLQIAK